MDETGDDNELMELAEASRALEVTPDRVEAMVQEGLLTPVGEGPDRRFRRSEVLAVRQLGA